MTLSGGMKRRVLIAKALSHEPQILFLDEPTAGVDVELRKDMWEVVRALRDSGVTIILTTHYIEEAEEMADRIGVINKGELILVEDKAELMRKLGKKQLTLQLQQKLDAIPPALAAYNLALAADGRELIYTYDTQGERTASRALLEDLQRAGHPASGPRDHAELARGHLRRPGEEGRMNCRAVCAIYRFEMARTGRTLLPEHRVAGDFDLALFRRVRRRDRLAHHRDRGRQLRRLHRAGPDHADAADAEHHERLVRHLFPAASSARSTSSSRRRCRPSRSCSAMSARPRPNRSSSA